MFKSNLKDKSIFLSRITVLITTLWLAFLFKLNLKLHLTNMDIKFDIQTVYYSRLNLLNGYKVSNSTHV